MAKNLIEEVKRSLNDPGHIERNAFRILAQISTLVNQAGDTREVQDLVLRALEQRSKFGHAEEILDSLVQKQGLYPYLEPDDLDFKDLIAYESHRPENLGNVVFHRVQARVYRLLMEGHNVVLSAPTSFGKSLIVDAIAASGKFRNIVVVVPTIALIDETRRRLFERFRASYKVITHSSQVRGERNIFVLTQERVFEFQGFDSADFFVIDEFYKLDPRRDAERSLLLNQAFYRLYSPSTQFYLLGPDIHGISSEFPKKFQCTFIRTDYATVVSEMKRINAGKDSREAKLVELCQTLDEPTLIYCSSPASTRKVATALQARIAAEPAPQLADAVKWVSEEYHPEWTLTRSLQHGIGIHHGRIPRALSQFIVRAFNSGLLKYLICTSTLIEGVNTKAKNVIIYDHKIAQQNIDFFTFNNIVGRSGRMFQHFIGRVFLFNDPPQEDLPLVEIPLVTQTADVPDSLLIQMEARDLTRESRERMKSLWDQDVLPLEVLQANRGIDPEAQIKLAKEIKRNPAYYHPNLAWTSIPDYDQLKAVCLLIWKYFIPDNRRRAGVSSGEQLAFRINRFRSGPRIAMLIEQELQNQDDPDAAVENSLDFLRFWADFAFPRYLMTVSRIQEAVFQSFGLEAGNYSFFASQVENHFAPSGIAALDEYGIPIQIGLKLKGQLGGGDDLDEVLAGLRNLDPSRTRLSRFERQIVEDAKSYV